jgi:hypothetical protein
VCGSDPLVGEYKICGQLKEAFAWSLHCVQKRQFIMIVDHKEKGAK